ncbi:MAG: GntR family transcriptional regulator [Spirochaetia bacterium]|jgi:DNA-binding GntR family transcriptional regulator
MNHKPSTIASRFSLSEQVRNYILERIATGEFAPGHRIIEARIAEDLHVSTIPVREAIRELVAKRVLEYLVHRGARVREVSILETVDALRVKAVLEALAARTAGQRIMRFLPEMRRYVQPMEDSAVRHDFVEYQNQNQRFHRAIVEASGNQILLSVWDSLAFEVRTRFIMDYLHIVAPEELAREHESILSAAESGDSEALAANVTAHANRIVEHLEKQMSLNAASSEKT